MIFANIEPNKQTGNNSGKHKIRTEHERDPRQGLADAEPIVCVDQPEPDAVFEPFPCQSVRVAVHEFGIGKYAQEDEAAVYKNIGRADFGNVQKKIIDEGKRKQKLNPRPN